MPRTITRQIVLAAAVSFLAALLVLGVGAPLLAQDHDRQALDAWLTSEANLVGDLARDGLQARDPNVLDPLAHRLGASAGVRVTLIAPDGLVLGESDEDRRTMENHAGRPEVAAALAGGVGNIVRHSDTVGRDLLYIAVPVRDAGALLGVARTALPLTALQSLATKLGALIVAVGIAASAVALLALVVLARAITRPIRTLTARAEALAGGAPSDFEIAGPEEVERLGGALRRMAATVTGERALAEAERDRLAVLINELTDVILIADADGRIVLANRAALQVLGSAAAPGHQLVEAIREHEVLDAVRRARIGVADEVAQIERSDPPRFARAIARRLADGQLLLVIQDLTNLRRLETVRRDFVANVSHELRTPIASLKAMTETLEDGAIDDPTAARDFVARMHHEIDAVAQLVEELLLLGGIESGQLPLRLERAAPADLLTRARDRFAPLAERSHVRLELDPIPTLPDVTADPERIAQVFANLIHNAVRYTVAGGEIHLLAETTGAAVAFSVRDTGHGIAAADLARIFERFYKGDRARTTGGTGLGLAIAKHIVQQHEGELRAQSEGPGRGATFTFTLPIAR
ncbi:MAG: phosphate regulon sensor histidine kinase PhoR [Candidatus Limnocylindrales bacterium]